MSDTINKNKVIEAQADEILNLMKNVEDLERDYRKLASDSNNLLNIIDNKDLLISSLKKKIRWSMTEDMLAIVVCAVMVAIGTTL